jgi:hypothetical protein
VDPFATTDIGGGEVDDNLDSNKNTKADTTTKSMGNATLPKPIASFDKDNVLVRHGGILDSLFTPAASKKKD